MDVKELLEARRNNTLADKIFASLEQTDSNKYLAKLVADVVPLVVSHFLTTGNKQYSAELKYGMTELKPRWSDDNELSRTIAHSLDSVPYKQGPAFHELLNKVLEGNFGISFETEFFEAGDFFFGSDSLCVYFRIK